MESTVIQFSARGGIMESYVPVLMIKEPYTTIIFVFLTLFLLVYNMDRKKKSEKKTKFSAWFDNVFACGSDYYCIDIKPENGGYKLVTLYNEFGDKNSIEFFVKTDKTNDEICTDVINELKEYIKKGENKDALLNALKIELSCEEESFNIKEDKLWQE